MEKELFSLLRIGLQTEKVGETQASNFSVLPQEDWQKIRTMADKQSVSAIVFDGLSLVVDTFGKDVIAPHIDKGWWRQYVFDWMGVVAQTEQRNKQQLEVMEDMASRWTVEGCRVMIFKGQANGIMYPHPNHRSPGDIDCYLMPDKGERLDVIGYREAQSEAYRRGNIIAREVGAKVDESWYKHSVISYRKETFENHQYFVHTRDGKRGKLLEKELENTLSQPSSFLPLASYALLPPTKWNAMFLTYHACAHFVSEGLRLKQILDWAMFLKCHQNDVDWNAFYGFCERNHLRKFADAMTHITEKCLGVQITNPAIVKDSPYAVKILENALYEDDYVFGSGEGSWHNRWHLVRNLFHYRWKYEDIYETSPWRQLWYYASGYLFHTE